jgi:hypothetical protein
VSARRLLTLGDFVLIRRTMNKLIELPVEIQAVIAAGIGFIVTEGLKALSQVLGKDISGAGAAITAALVTAVIVFANALLAIVPAEYQSLAQALLGVLVAVLGAFGIHRQFRRFAY